MGFKHASDQDTVTGKELAWAFGRIFLQQGIKLIILLVLGTWARKNAELIPPQK